MTDSSEANRPTPTVRIGKLALTGPWALVAMVVLLALAVAIVVASRPRISMLVAGAVWASFTVYWSVASLKTAKATRAESAASRGRHQLLLNVALLLLFVPIPGLEVLEGATAPAGLAILAGGAWLYIWSRRELGRNWSGEISVKRDHRLVRTGPYRLVRHPMYTAILAMALGTAIVANRWSALLGVAVMAWAYTRKIGIEERWMREEFGADYEAYRRASWALVPPLY